MRRLGYLLRAAWEEYERDRARYFAGAMVYFALMSVIPLLLLLLAVIGWSLRFSSATAALEGHLLDLVEANLGEQFETSSRPCSLNSSSSR